MGRTVEVRAHWTRLAELGCVVSGGPATIHHCHGGSMRLIGVHKGMGQKTSDWLCIPLAARYHTGCDGIDAGVGVATWEARFGTQVEHLDAICRRLGYNVWHRAGVAREVEGC